MGFYRIGLIVSVLFTLPLTKMNQRSIWQIVITLSTEEAEISVIHMVVFSLREMKVKRFRGGRRRFVYKYEAKANIQVTRHVKPQIASFPR